MSEIEQLKARIKELEDEKEHIFAFLNKYFEPPCQHEYSDIPDAWDFINYDKVEDGGSWCEDNCGTDDKGSGGTKCWRRFFEILRRCEKEQLEYGKDE